MKAHEEALMLASAFNLIGFLPERTHVINPESIPIINNYIVEYAEQYVPSVEQVLQYDFEEVIGTSIDGTVMWSNLRTVTFIRREQTICWN